MIKYNNILLRLFTVVAALLLGVVSLSAQLLPERSLVREGNEQFRRRNFSNSLNRYNEALEYAPGSYEALYNRANAFMHLMFTNPQDTIYNSVISNKYFEEIANNQYLSKEQRAEVLRNLGESLFLQQEYEAALNSFRESLKLNPDDQETKRNFVLTKRIVDQKRNAKQQQQQNNQQSDQQNNQNNQQQNDQNQDGSGDGDNSENPDNQNQDNNNSENEGNNDSEEQKNPEDGEGDDESDEHTEREPNQEGLNDEQERMLDAIQAEENKTQDKLKDGKKGVVVQGKKNW